MTNATKYDGATMRALGALDRQLQNHIHSLMSIDCESTEAMEAIVFAIRQAEDALVIARDAKRQAGKVVDE